eukprot:TRINITY_DN2500_c0_g2_i4.p2 TRINITY_DN2500_c0_g2~~TRINITY_DN2500_c0_g2_i4.p2  ORF type:complete len:260 (+),score=32.40 TRINITY_DN2500_c0_g2_i4:275-1054(+)
MLRLDAWLRTSVPQEDAGKDGPCKGLVHEDYRLNNLVFQPTEPRMVAVLDLELLTLGNQMSDVAYFCMPYHLPGACELVLPAFRRQPNGLVPSGIPSEAAFLAEYCRETAGGELRVGCFPSCRGSPVASGAFPDGARAAQRGSAGSALAVGGAMDGSSADGGAQGASTKARAVEPLDSGRFCGLGSRNDAARGTRTAAYWSELASAILSTLSCAKSWADPCGRPKCSPAVLQTQATWRAALVRDASTLHALDRRRCSRP